MLFHQIVRRIVDYRFLKIRHLEPALAIVIDEDAVAIRYAKCVQEVCKHFAASFDMQRVKKRVGKPVLQLQRLRPLDDLELSQRAMVFSRKLRASATILTSFFRSFCVRMNDSNAEERSLFSRAFHSFCALNRLGRLTSPARVGGSRSRVLELAGFDDVMAYFVTFIGSEPVGRNLTLAVIRGIRFLSHLGVWLQCLGLERPPRIV